MSRVPLPRETGDSAAAKTLEFLQGLLADFHPRNFSIVLWDGTSWEPEPGQFSRFRWKINRPGALRSAFAESSALALAEAYIYGDFDFDGELEGIFPLADYLAGARWTKFQKLRLRMLLAELPADSGLQPLRPGNKLRGKLHSRERDRQAVSYHYDLSNDFYSLWLDPGMSYSCAYFSRADEDLASAQKRKLRYICRKLRLKPGERLLDIGCGWGGLVMHAAGEYGVNALGITLSQQQFELAERRILEAGLSGHCQVKLLDYRDVEEPGAYDKAVSIGMMEHVGEAMLPEYFRCAYRALRPGGVFLNHAIGTPAGYVRSREPSFSDLYVFPDGEFVPIGTATLAAEQAGLEVRDVENLREHYAMTLHHWVRGMEQHREEARRVVDETTYRIWRLHMAGSGHYFRSGKLDLYQTLLVKNENGRSGLPLTRDDWYTEKA